LAAALLIFKLIREPRQEEPPSGTQPQVPVRFSQIFRNRDLWMLYIGGIPAIYAVWMAGTWVPAMFHELGVENLATSSLLGSLVGISAIPGLILTGMLSDRMTAHGMGRKGLVGMEYLLLAISLLLMGLAVRHQWSPAAAAVVVFFVGLFAWGHWAAFYALIADIVPNEVRGTCYGLTNSINFIGSLLAPPLTGWIKDVTASFAWGCYLAAVLIVIGSIFIFCVRPPFRFQPECPISPAP
jgi:MFS family permease